MQLDAFLRSKHTEIGVRVAITSLRPAQRGCHHTGKIILLFLTELININTCTSEKEKKELYLDIYLQYIPHFFARISELSADTGCRHCVFRDSNLLICVGCVNHAVCDCTNDDSDGSFRHLRRQPLPQPHSLDCPVRRSCRAHHSTARKNQKEG